MRKGIMSFLSVVMAFVMVAGSTLAVNAAELDLNSATDVEQLDVVVDESVVDYDEPVEPDEPDEPLADQTGNVNWAWKRVTTTFTNGMNRNIRITINGSVGYYADVKMIDTSGQVVWYEPYSFALSSGSYREYWCGSNVASVWVKVSKQSIFLPLNETIQFPYVVQYL